MSRVENQVTMHRLLATLTDQEGRIIGLRFPRRWSQSRIADEIGVSQVQVSRLRRAILTELAHRGTVLIRDRPARTTGSDLGKRETG